MAASLAEDLVCPICLGLFQEPHMLPGCGHNFCLACLRSAVPGGQGAGACPECRGPFQMAELKSNRPLGSLAGKMRRWRVDEAPLPGAAAGPWHFCEEHDEPLKLFCTQHEAPLCVICRDLPQHRRHRFLPLKEAAKFAQGRLKVHLKPLKKLLQEKTKNGINQQKKIEALENFSEDLLDHISRGFEALHQILHSKEQDMKLLAEEAKKENMERMEDSLASLKKEISSCTETIDKVETAFEAADLVDFLKGFKQLMEQVMEDNQRKRDDSDEDEKTADEDKNCDEEDADAEVISVSQHLKRFKDLLDFEVWKEKLERNIPGKDLLSQRSVPSRVMEDTQRERDDPDEEEKTADEDCDEDEKTADEDENSDEVKNSKDAEGIFSRY